MDTIVASRLLQIQSLRESSASKDEFDQYVLRIWRDDHINDAISKSKQNRFFKESNRIKGIKNDVGENNCFLNSIIQNMWHLNSFRSKFMDVNHPKHGRSCVFCALRNIFIRYKSEEELTPIDLRNALSLKEERFKPGESEDAQEVYDVLLDNLHSCLENDCKNGNQCVIHSVFSLSISENYECQCGKTTDMFRYDEWIHYIPVDMILMLKDSEERYSFSEMIFKASNNDSRPCDSCDGGELVLKRRLTSVPDVLTIGLSWSTMNPHSVDIEELLNSIESQVNTKDMFSETPSNVYMIKGVLCYSAMHYLTIIKIGRNWIKFDDSSCKIIGASWKSVSEYMKQSLLQCHTVWYERSM